MTDDEKRFTDALEKIAENLEALQCEIQDGSCDLRDCRNALIALVPQLQEDRWFAEAIGWWD